MAKKGNLQDRMNSLKPYFKAVEMYNEALIVRVVYPSNWTAYGSADERIKVTPSDTNPNETYYYGSSEETSYDEMFDLIEETIHANNEINLKLQLLHDKGEELKELFSRLPYEELKTLEFVTSSKKKNNKKRGSRKKKVEDNVEIIEERKEGNE